MDPSPRSNLNVSSGIDSADESSEIEVTINSSVYNCINNHSTLDCRPNNEQNAGTAQPDIPTATSLTCTSAESCHVTTVSDFSQFQQQAYVQPMIQHTQVQPQIQQVGLDPGLVPVVYNNIEPINVVDQPSEQTEHSTPPASGFISSTPNCAKQYENYIIRNEYNNFYSPNPSVTTHLGPNANYVQDPNFTPSGQVANPAASSLGPDLNNVNPTQSFSSDVQDFSCANYNSSFATNNPAAPTAVTGGVATFNGNESFVNNMSEGTPYLSPAPSYTSLSDASCQSLPVYAPPPPVQPLVQPLPQSHDASPPTQQEFPLVFATPAGVINVVLRYDVLVEIGDGQAFRVINHRHHSTAALDASGRHAALHHSAGRVRHDSGAGVTDMQLFWDRRVRLTPTEYQFQVGRTAWAVSESRMRPVAQPDFRAVPDTAGADLLTGVSGAAELCRAALREWGDDGSVEVKVAGVRVQQTRGGEVQASTVCGGRFIYASPVYGTLWVAMPEWFARVDMHWLVRVSLPRIQLTLTASFTGLHLRDPRTECGVDEYHEPFCAAVGAGGSSSCGVTPPPFIDPPRWRRALWPPHLSPDSAMTSADRLRLEFVEESGFGTDPVIHNGGYRGRRGGGYRGGGHRYRGKGYAGRAGYYAPMDSPRNFKKNSFLPAPPEAAGDEL